MLLIFITCIQYIITSTTPGIHSFSLMPGKYLIEFYGAQKKFEEKNKEYTALSKGEYINITIVIEGKTQHFTAFLGNQIIHDQKKKNSQESFIILNSNNQNNVIAVTGSGKLNQNSRTSSINLLSQLKEKLLKKSPLLDDIDIKDNEKKS